MVWYWAGPDAIGDAAKAVAAATGDAKKAAEAALDAVTADAGLLFQWGALDFAGGTVVHINAGIAGLVGALDPRQARRLRHGADASALADHDHDRRRAAVGRLVRLQRRLEPRSQRHRRPRHDQHLRRHRRGRRSPGCSSEWMVKGKPSLLGLVSGVVAGLVAVTPASGFAGPMGSIVLGLVAGVVCFIFCTAHQERARLRRQPRRVRRPLRRRHHRRARAPASWSTRRSAAPASSTTPRSPARLSSPPTIMAAQVMAQVKAVGFTLAVVRHRLGDPLQARRRRSIGLRPTTSRSARASTSPSTASAPTTTETLLCVRSHATDDGSRARISPGRAHTGPVLQRRADFASARRMRAGRDRSPAAAADRARASAMQPSVGA